MKILIYGAGAIGGYLGAHLIQAGHTVTLLTRPQSAAQLRKHGLLLNEAESIDQFNNSRYTHVHPEIITSLQGSKDENEEYGVVILTTKSYDAVPALHDIAECIPSSPMVITFQNGIGIEEEAIALFGEAHVIAGSVTTPVSRDAEGALIVEKAGRGIVLAPVRPDAIIDSWYNLFAASALHTDLQSDYRAVKWSKALLNIIANATSAILDWEPRVIYNHRGLFQLEIGMLREALQVMRHLNIPVIDLPGASARQLARAVRYTPTPVLKPFLARKVGSGRGNKMPSFHIDLMRGKEMSEVLYHNGAIAEQGSEIGIPTPINTTLTEIMLKLAKRQLNHEAYRNAPIRLLKAVEQRRRLWGD